MNFLKYFQSYQLKMDQLYAMVFFESPRRYVTISTSKLTFETGKTSQIMNHFRTLMHLQISHQRHLCVILCSFISHTVRIIVNRRSRRTHEPWYRVNICWTTIFSRHLSITMCGFILECDTTHLGSTSQVSCASANQKSTEWSPS